METAQIYKNEKKTKELMKKQRLYIKNKLLSRHVFTIAGLVIREFFAVDVIWTRVA